MQKGATNREQIGFSHGEIPVEDFDELALDSANVAFAERARDHSPMDVFQSRVVGVFGSDYESAEENAVECPLLGLNGEIRSGTLDVHEGDKDVGHGDFSSLEDFRHELGELRVLARTGDCASAR